MADTSRNTLFTPGYSCARSLSALSLHHATNNGGEGWLPWKLLSGGRVVTSVCVSVRLRPSVSSGRCPESLPLLVRSETCRVEANSVQSSILLTRNHSFNLKPRPQINTCYYVYLFTMKKNLTSNYSFSYTLQTWVSICNPFLTAYASLRQWPSPCHLVYPKEWQ